MLWSTRLAFVTVTAFAFAALPANASSAAAETSIYTDLDLDACEVEQVFEETEGAVLRYPGLGEIPVFVSDFDARTDVDFGARDQTFDTFSPFNSPGERVEWRLDGDRPLAAILRFKLQVDETASRDVLAIFKVGSPPETRCPVAYVDAALNQDANLVARQVADVFARAFRCGVDQATYVGQTDERSGQASATLERQE